MAYQFDGIDDYIEGGSAPVTAAPLTIAAWFKLDSVAVDGTILSIGISGSTHRFQMYTASAAGFGLAANCVSATSGRSEFSGALSTGTWYHGCAVYASTTSRTAYLDGVAGTANTTSITPSGLNRIHIGARISTTLGNWLPGSVAEPAVWSVALSADEIASLAKGFSPEQIKPGSLRFYSPLLRETIDIARGIALTVSGAAAVAHPRIIK